MSVFYYISVLKTQGKNLPSECCASSYILFPLVGGRLVNCNLWNKTAPSEELPVCFNIVSDVSPSKASDIFPLQSLKYFNQRLFILTKLAPLLTLLKFSAVTKPWYIFKRCTRPCGRRCSPTCPRLSAFVLVQSSGEQRQAEPVGSAQHHRLAVDLRGQATTLLLLERCRPKGPCD